MGVNHCGLVALLALSISIVEVRVIKILGIIRINSKSSSDIIEIRVHKYHVQFFG